jgi:predicted nuclease of predicted toxin-antitoxin system
MDEHIPGPASMGLRGHGLDVLTVQEAGRDGLPDDQQLAFALAEERVLVTFDPDFLALHLAAAPHAGIAWCPAQKYSIGQLIQALLLLHGVLDRASMKGHVEYL